MAIISKLDFRECVTEPAITCSALIHPWTKSCTKAQGKIISSLVVGAAKFFLPIYLLQIILKGKKTTKSFLKDLLLKCYPRSILYAIVYGSSFVAANCFLRACTGAFHYYTIGFASGIVGGMAIFIESKRYKYLNTVLYFNLIVEALIRLLHNEKIINRTPLKEAVIFMISSAILMYLKTGQNDTPNITNLWFYTPSKIYPTVSEIDCKATLSENRNECFHMKDNTSCKEYIIQGTYDYFRIGYALQIAKTLIGKFDKVIRSPKALIKTAFSKKNVRFGCFLGGYVAIYRLMCCYLRRKDGTEKRMHTLIAGFLAGSTYLIEPNLGFPVIAFTTILQLQIAKMRENGQIKNQMVLTQLLFAFCSGIVFHFRFLHVESCPNYIPNMLKTFTSGLLDKIFNHVLSFLPEHCKK